VGKRETSSIRETAKEYFLKHYLTLSLPSIILHILVKKGFIAEARIFTSADFLNYFSMRSVRIYIAA
jgi:hypothetical protein